MTSPIRAALDRLEALGVVVDALDLRFGEAHLQTRNPVGLGRPSSAQITVDRSASGKSYLRVELAWRVDAIVYRSTLIYESLHHFGDRVNPTAMGWLWQAALVEPDAAQAAVRCAMHKPQRSERVFGRRGIE